MSSLLVRVRRAVRAVFAPRVPYRWAASSGWRTGWGLAVIGTLAAGSGPRLAAQDASVSPSYSPIARPANTSNQTVTFGISNLTGSSIAFVLHCTATGFVTSCSSPTKVSIPGYGFSQVTVTFSTGASGSGTLSESASDPNGGASGEYAVSQALANVAVTPDSASVQAPDSTTGSVLSYLFTVTNTGNTSGTIALTLPTCQLPATGCVLTRTSLNLSALASDTVRVTYNTGTAGSGGQIRIRGTVGAFQNDGWINVAAYVHGPLQNPAIAGPGTERAQCLTIAAGPAGASECGDLRLVHGLPRMTTKGKVRAPTLLYNSQTAHPYVVVADSVGLLTTDPVPTNVQATLTVNGTALPTQTWTGSNWSPGTMRRIAVGFDALAYATGSYPYSLALQKLVSGSLLTIRTDTGHVIIVNRSGSVFRPGWWLAGLEQLIGQTDGSKLFIGGDATTRIYYPVSGRSGLWAAPQVDRPDLLQKRNGYYVQLLTNGTTVYFDTATGMHRKTINRLGDTTVFTWSDSTCQHLNAITVPLGPAPTYQFHYTGSGCPTLTSVGQTTSGVTRTTTLALASNTLTITDPDTTTVRYLYSVTTGHQNQIVTRYNRLNDTTTYSYDAAAEVSQVSMKMRGATAVTTAFTNLTTKSLNGATAIDTSKAFTTVNGPRTDVGDTTEFWLARFGAPRKVRDALGDTTVLTRGDARWPALVTNARMPNGQLLAATYDTHGNLLTSTDSSTHRNNYGQTLYATTQYAWDLEWNLPTQITLPEGNDTQLAYDLATGNLVWAQDGRGAASRTTFHYVTSGAGTGLVQSAVLSSGATTSFTYDAAGNLASTQSPLGYHRYLVHDAFGRDSVARTQLDVAGTYYASDSTRYNLTDQPTRVVHYGPAMNGAVAQRAIVQTYYDHEGRDTAVATSSVPDSAGIGTLTTRFHFDPLGRTRVTIAGDGHQDSVVYDPAGNDTLTITRRGKSLRKVFDALNRLTTLRTDSVLYPARIQGLATVTGEPSYPRYPNAPSGGYAIPGDTATFTYDAVGHVLTANNASARVTRTYDANGLDSTETEAIRTYADTDFTTHVYTLRSTYDLNGRRTGLTYPIQLAGPADSIINMYDAVSGNLWTVYDLAHNTYTFRSDSLDEVTRIDYPGNIFENFHYLADGSLASDTLNNSSTSAHKYADALLRSTTFSYDARGKLLTALNQSGPQDHRWMLYSGLGHLTQSADSSYNMIIGGGRQAWTLTEGMRYDALGNQTADTRIAANIPWPDSTTFSESGTAYHYATTGTARLTRDVGSADDSLLYNAAGANEFQYSTFSADGFRHDRASFYAADNTLRAVDNRSAHVAGHLIDGGIISTFEEYRYDALGRRILTRSHHYCDAYLSDGVMCLVSFIRRTVWDGSQELAEIQMPAGDSATTTPVASPTLVETDTGRIAILRPMTAGSNTYDANQFFGRVLYTYGVHGDEPLALWRAAYVEDTVWGQYPIPDPQDTIRYFAPFTVVPHWDNRGVVDVGTFADGGYTYCEAAGSAQRCVLYAIWPYGQSSYYQHFVTWSDWLGSLVDGKQDASGLLYRRNRYLDPATGRFTQEDPLGLAGGLNTYGFANGDPVNFSDPFGLCADGDWKCEIAKAAYEVTGAVIGGAAGFTGGAAAGVVCGPLVEVCSPVLAVSGAIAVGGASAVAAGRAIDSYYNGVSQMSRAGKGRGGNRVPNKDVERIVKENDLNRAGQRALHDQITGQDFSSDDIRELAKQLAEQNKYRNLPH